MKPIFVNLKKSDRYYNIGDEASSPLNYFSWDADTACLTNVPDNGAPLVIGGGGLLNPETTAWLTRQVEKRKVVIWGAGLNFSTVASVPLSLILALEKCYLAGIRDRKFVFNCGGNLDYVPCPSCLNPALGEARKIKPTQQAVFYRHSWGSDCPLDLPRMFNMDIRYKMDDAIKFLASAEIVVTNSYHGAYWAMLLGRQVIIWQAEGQRFYTGLPKLPVFAHTERQLKALLHAYTTQWATRWASDSLLMEQQSRSRRFAHKVIEVLQIVGK